MVGRSRNGSVSSGGNGLSYGCGCGICSFGYPLTYPLTLSMHMFFPVNFNFCS